MAVLIWSSDVSARQSGGYSRSGGVSRTPSFGGGGSGGYRTPSFKRGSGGYGLPSSNSRGRSYAPPSSAGDRSFSQDRSGSAYDNYRTQQNAPRQQDRSPPLPQYERRPSTQPQYAPDRSGWLNNRGWTAPSNYGVNRSFGVWDGLFLWSLLSNLGQAGSSDWFHNNQNDPGYQQWRREADRQAAENVDLRKKLDDLDRQLAERDGQPRTPGALPPDVPPEVAKAPPSRTPEVPEDAGGGAMWPFLLAGAGGAGFLVWRRRSATKGSGVNSSGSPLDTAGSLLKRKLSGEAYAPSKFRVGMTIALDPTPFILAGSAIKLRPPQDHGTGRGTVSAVGRVVSGQTQMVRLYLTDEGSLIQLHLDAAGEPDECRLFGRIDEITPADPEEWGAWLDPNEGMIGWPDFQTKDGKTYSRVWAPGDSRVSPRVFDETIEDLSGVRTAQSQVMLYAAATGAPDPAPAAEYIMVAAVKNASRAWVEIWSGVDVSPATLQLS